jgi:hypothetical protein
VKRDEERGGKAGEEGGEREGEREGAGGREVGRRPVTACTPDTPCDVSRTHLSLPVTACTPYTPCDPYTLFPMLYALYPKCCGNTKCVFRHEFASESEVREVHCKNFSLELLRRGGEGGDRGEMKASESPPLPGAEENEPGGGGKGTGEEGGGGPRGGMGGIGTGFSHGAETLALKCARVRIFTGMYDWYVYK